MTATTNKFSRRIKEKITTTKTTQAIIENLELVFLNLGAKDANLMARKIMQLEQKEGRTFTFEENAFRTLEKNNIHKNILKERMKRSKVIFEQVRPYLYGETVLDLGCGNGEIGLFIAQEGFNVALTDVYEHKVVKTTNLPFKRFEQGKKVNYHGDTFDTTLLLTVLHHAENPMQVLKEAKRVTKSGGRIIVIESVIGVQGTGRKFFQLNEEQQFQANCFFDYFSNRVMQYTADLSKKINVPCNFNTPTGWKNIFESLGLMEIKRIDLGFDQAVVPEYHTLHVLEVKK